MRPEHRIEGIDEEKCIFEVRKYEKVYENTENQIGFPFPLLFGPMDCITYEIVQYNINYQQDKEESARLVVEEQACKEQIQRPEFRTVADERLPEQNHCEEYPEEHLRENQWRILIVQKYALQKFYHNPIFEGAKLIF